MTPRQLLPLNRRAFLTGAAAAATALVLPRAHAATRRTLTAAPSNQILGTGRGSAVVDTWSYDGQVPGPLLRYRRGDRLDVTFRNELPEPSAVHWHGLRPPNAMDGAAPLTQPPVAPGEIFHYAFDLEDAGTYWYHTHFRGWNQQDRGLYGVLIVDEESPPAVDRDVVLVLDDWVMTRRGTLSEEFGAMHEWAHAGRLGNLATINNAADAVVPLTAGERVRLRLANVANAQIFALMFPGHPPVVIAEDGNPTTPRALGEEPLVMGPGQRVDLILDATGEPGSRHPIVAHTLRDEVRLGTFVYGAAPGGSGLAGTDVPALETNTRPSIDVAGAQRIELAMEGGAMGGMRGAMMGGRMMEMRELARNGRIWALNGVAGDMDTPLATLRRGESVIVDMVNDTAFPHAMHLHGMHFKEVARDGAPVTDGSWRDTTVMAADERVSIAFVAETPGKWMLHCHMIEHQSGGMMTWLDVTDDPA